MKLFWQPASRYSARVAIQMSAKGLDFERELVGFPIADEFARINPRKMIPVLEVDGLYLPEAAVICEYLEDLGKGPSLRPDDPFERARMRLIVRNYELYCDPLLLGIYGAIRRRDTAANISRLADDLRFELDRLADNLDGGAYAVGDSLTLADCALAPPFLQMSLLFPAIDLVNPVQESPVLSAYFETLRQDPHAGPVLEDMVGPFSKGLGAWLGLGKPR